ncbi:hypothetical protein BDV28DRAFT_132671 [Aspergillus coremiiformis]|uniref:RING-type domain-containing protein n=1 Tax=Aspergillus coremiiformis TaxID=138285 RepID=A0A5N6ZA06_9EURO|nr:hypothetical protein BDV28DRAFT_132671 [Aspergillus coremiiformis]
MGSVQDPSFFPFPFHLLSLILLFILSTTVSAVDSSGWSVVPSNNSRNLSWVGKAKFHLESAQIQLPSGVSVAPLTTSLINLNQAELKNFDVTGNLVNVDATNAISLNSGDIALISCDHSAYPGNLNASETVRNAITSPQPALAILLYSSEVHHCNYTASQIANGYYNVFTLVNPTVAKTVINASLLSTGNGTTSIVPDMSFTVSGTTSTAGDSGGGADSPNTAMIILYSITGIITALFLAIIITGAVRAHRHPERYGPRYTAGRPRQSRAKGIARAMLDTIPIVKFGDQQDPKLDAVKGDVEMGPEDEAARRLDTCETMTVNETNPQATAALATDNTITEPNQEQQAKTTTESTDYPNFSCPICTDDFIKGQDLRVLPCNHQFHPECIDPWLVNVSGTCPLCRIDLNPAHTEGERENQEGADHAETHQDGTNERAPEESRHRQHRRLSSYLHDTLNARRMREATVEERLAALRSVREENRNSVENEDAEERQRLRSRLTSRLRDRFRIRTRQHGDDGDHRDQGEPSVSST